MEYCGKCIHLDVCKSADAFDGHSREAHKSLHFKSELRNQQVHDYHRRGINAFCGTNFTKGDIELIYTYLGNGVNRPKTLAFIHSGYDLAVLERREGE